MDAKSPGKTPGSDVENTAHMTIEQAGASLSASHRDIPNSFAAQLFARAVPEDVVHYGPADLAMLAGRAWDFLGQRQPSTPKIRFDTVTLQGSGERQAITVLEIVNDDMPFLFNSVMGELSERRLPVRLVTHPIFGVKRDAAGKLTGFGAADAAGSARESFIHIHVDSIGDDALRQEIVETLRGVLGEVRLAVQDWKPMLERVNGLVAELKTNPPPLPVDEIAEAIQFLQWLLADNFTFIGMRDYVFDGRDLAPNFDSGLGIMRSRELRVLGRGREQLEFTPEIMAFLKEPRPLIIAKANIQSHVHRRVYLDYIGIKLLRRGGKSRRRIPHRRLVHLDRLYALGAQHSVSAPQGRPVSRSAPVSIRTAMSARRGERTGALPARRIVPGRRGDALSFRPRHHAARRAAAHARPGAARPIRSLRLGAGVHAARPLRQRDPRQVGEYLASAFVGRVSAFYPFFPEGPLVRAHFIIGRNEGATPQVDRETLERRDRRHRAHLERRPHAGAVAGARAGGRARAVCAVWRRLFAGFREAYAPSVAANDIRVIEGLDDEAPARRRFPSSPRGRAARGGTENLELRATAAAVGARAGAGKYGLSRGGRAHLPYRAETRWRPHRLVPRHAARAARRNGHRARKGKARLEAAFLMVMRGAAENDGYNALTLAGGLGWRDVALIRALSRYLRQIRVPYSQEYMWATLVRHS